MIVFDSVTKTFSTGHNALEDVSFEIEPGEFVAVVGPSGSGKTTLLRLIIREILPTAGQIRIADHDLTTVPKKEIPHLRRQIGAAFQDFKLISDKSAYENVAVMLDILGKTKAEIAKITELLLDRVGLKDKLWLFPSQLSGGEIQRVAIARALASDPILLFADEPTGNLDSETSEQIVALLKKINDTGTTIIMSTHDHGLAQKYATRHLHLRSGKLVKDTKASKQKLDKKAGGKT